MSLRSVTALCLAALGFALAQTMVTPILPLIGDQMNSDVSTTTWVLSAYLLSAALVIPVTARLGDTHGRRRLLLWTLVLFMGGSLMCALASSIELLIVGRVLQGLGGATLPLTLALTRDCVPVGKTAQAVGAISATVGAGGVIGLLIGSVLVEAFGLGSIFLLNIPLGLAAIVAVRRWVPDHRPQEGTRAPLLDIKLMRNRTVFLSNTIGFALGAAKFGTFILIPEFVLLLDGSKDGLLADNSAFFLLPFAVAVILAAPSATRLAARFGTKLVLTFGIALAGSGFYALAVGEANPALIFVATGVLGLGVGTSITVAATLVVTSVARERAGAAAGMHTISRMLGGFAGGQLAAVLMAAHISAGTGHPDSVAFGEAFTLLAGILFVAAIAAVAVPRRSARLVGA